MKDGQVITDSLVEVLGTADATGGFKGWALDFAHSSDPENWFQMIESRQPVRNGLLSMLDLGGVGNGAIILRLRIVGPNDAYAEKTIRLLINLPIPPTLIPTFTPTFTPTFVPPMDTPIETPTPTPTLEPLPTPTETETPTLPPP